MNSGLSHSFVFYIYILIFLVLFFTFPPYSQFLVFYFNLIISSQLEFIIDYKG